MRYDPNDVVELDDDPYAQAATFAAGAPVGRAPGGVAYPLYGVGQAAPNGNGAPNGAPMMAQAQGLVQRLKWPFIGFLLGAATVGGAWFYFGHWKPLQAKAKGRKRRAA